MRETYKRLKGIHFGQRNQSIREDLNRQQNARYKVKKVKETVSFSLEYDKEQNLYVLLDKKKQVSIELTKKMVMDSEIAIGDAKEFNRIASKLFK